MEQFGKYEIIRELGRGGMGVVFHVRDTDLGREVALKVMKPDSSWTEQESTEFRRRFEIEARATAALDHFNIVTLFDRGEVNGVPFMAMAFVEGETLEALLKRRGGTLPVDEAVRILRPIGRALDYAHSRNVIHRDIKPANIMIRHDGHVLVMDFGIAKAAHVDTRNSSKLFGSPRYMAPEQLRFEKPGKAIDQWSLGVMAYEMLSGAWPFPESPEEGPYYAILNSPPAVMAGLPDELNEAVGKALEKRAEARYGSCSAFVEALAAAGAARPVWVEAPTAQMLRDATVPVGNAPRTATVVQSPGMVRPPVVKTPSPPDSPVVPDRSTAFVTAPVRVVPTPPAGGR